MSDQGRLIIIGAGELSNYVIHEAKNSYESVLAVTKTERRHESLEKLGAQPTTQVPIDVSESDDVLFSVAGSQKQQQVLEALRWRQLPRRAVLVSSVGFYGTPQGIVTEVTPKGDTPHSDAIKSAESVFLERFHSKGIILRAGGLYSEFKGPFISFIKKKTASIAPANRTLTLVHYHDLALAIIGVFRHPDPDGLYNVVSWPSPTREVFYKEAANKLKLEPPTFSENLPHPPAQYDVSSLRSDILPQPKYPDWRAIFN